MLEAEGSRTASLEKRAETVEAGVEAAPEQRLEIGAESEKDLPLVDSQVTTVRIKLSMNPLSTHNILLSLHSLIDSIENLPRTEKPLLGQSYSIFASVSSNAFNESLNSNNLHFIM